MGVDAGTIWAEVRIQLDKITGDVQSMQKSFDQFAQRNKQQADQVSKSWIDGVEKMKLEHIAAFAAIGLAVAKSVEVFAKVESAITDVQVKARASPADFKAMEDAIKAVGSTTHISAESAAKALQQIVGAGFDAKKSLDVLNGAVLLSEATDADAATSAKTLATTIKMFGLQASDATKLTNVFAATIAKSNTTVESLAAGLHAFGPLASDLGISIEELSSAIGILSQAGYEGSEAGMALRNVIGSFANETDPMVKKLEGLGIAFSDIDPRVNSLADIIGALADADMNASQATDVFGNRVGAQMLALMKAGAEGVRDFTAAITDTNAAVEAQALHDETLAEKLEIAQNSFKSAGVALMEQLAPALKLGADLVAKLVNFFSSLPAPLKLFFGIAAAGIPVVVGLSAAISVLGGVLGTIAGPITLVVGGIAALVAGVSAIGGAVRQARLDSLEENFGAVAKQVGITSEQVAQLDDGMKKFFNFTKADARTIEDQFAQWAEATGMTKAHLLDIALTNKQLTADQRIILEGMQAQAQAAEDAAAAQKKAEEEKNKKATDAFNQSMYQAERIRQKTEKDARAEEERNKVQINARKEAQDEYDKALAHTQALLDAGAISYADALKQEITATTKLIDVLVTAGYTGKQTGQIGDKMMSDAVKHLGELNAALDDNAWMTQEVARLQKEYAAAAEALDQANKDANTTAEDYDYKLKQIGETELGLINIEWQRAVAAVRASGASQEAIEKTIAALDKYFLALKDDLAYRQAAENAKKMLDKLEGNISFATRVMSDLEKIVASDAEEMASNVISAMSDIAKATGTKYGELAGFVLDLMNGFRDLIASIMRQVAGSQKDLKEDMESAQMQLYDLWIKRIEDARDKELEAIRDTLDADLEALEDREEALQDYHDRRMEQIDDEEQAELERLGLTEETAQERLRRKLEEIDAEIAAETDADKLKALEAERAEEAKQLARQIVLDKYDKLRKEQEDKDKAEQEKIDAEKKKAQDDADSAEKEAKDKADKAERKYLHDKAILERDIALAHVNIEWKRALADLGWFPSAESKKSVNDLYNELYTLICATPIPAAKTGGIVLPTAGGSLIRVAENRSAELMLNSGPEGRAFLRDFAHEIVGAMGDIRGEMSAPINIDGKKVAEVTARYFNNGITRLNKRKR